MQFHTTKAVEQQNDHQSKDTWSIADAILADVPEGEPGNIATRAATIPAMLEAIAKEMADNDLYAPNGLPYTVDALRALRNTAMQWPENERQAQASYRTHQGAGGKESRGRIALKALAEYVETGKVNVPGVLDEDKFAQACDVIARNKTRYPISANALRVALEQKPNVPNRIPTTSIEFQAMLAKTGNDLSPFFKAFANRDDDITEIERDGLCSAIGALIRKLELAMSMVRGVTEIDIAYLESSDS